ncbi:MAG: 16S rRNA (cytidine(1402)-2'-O)-methyltransferase [Candidatus Paceibacterota bacterium]|jgi:16S rRNA (cytidine1402-2'-O)-methyltransferase
METEKENVGMLLVVATPIGNLKDITLRALEVLKLCDVVFAEDTRVSAKLLAHFEIKKPVFRYDEHSHALSVTKIAKLLVEKKRVVLITDAGTPGIADPGSRLIAAIHSELPEVPIVPIPGPSALITLLSVSGMNTEQFTFLGYPPHKKGRETFFRKIKEIPVWPVVLYESPHRIVKTFHSIVEQCGEERMVVVGRELTKMYEEIFRGTAKAALQKFEANVIRGEFVIVISQ